MRTLFSPCVPEGRFNRLGNNQFNVISRKRFVHFLFVWFCKIALFLFGWITELLLTDFDSIIHRIIQIKHLPSGCAQMQPTIKIYKMASCYTTSLLVITGKICIWWSFFLLNLSFFQHISSPCNRNYILNSWKLIQQCISPSSSFLHPLPSLPTSYSHFSPSMHVLLPPLPPSLYLTSISKPRSGPFILPEICLIPTGRDPGLEWGPESCLARPTEGSCCLFWFGRYPRVLERKEVQDWNTLKCPLWKLGWVSGCWIWNTPKGLSESYNFERLWWNVLF